MKFYETHFEEYINANKNENIHPKLDKIYEKFPKDIKDMRNIIFYGPAGTGKYTQMLKSIKTYSHSNLKYEKKINIEFQKQQYFFKISDIHYEIDMSLLGCNSKILWNEIYQQFVDIISVKPEKSGIIVCKYFQEINSELLEIFYSYMQKNIDSNIHLVFILITENISFIPDNILNCCEVISVARPTKTVYNKCIKSSLMSKINLENIDNIKKLIYLKNNILSVSNTLNTLNTSNTSLKTSDTSNDKLIPNYKNICDKIIYFIKNKDQIDFLKMRDTLYDILIYNLDVGECIWYILSVFIDEKRIKKEKLTDILIKTFNFFKYYNNNYRPIYHLENFVYYLILNIS